MKDWVRVEGKGYENEERELGMNNGWKGKYGGGVLVCTTQKGGISGRRSVV